MTSEAGLPVESHTALVLPARGATPHGAAIHRAGAKARTSGRATAAAAAAAAKAAMAVSIQHHPFIVMDTILHCVPQCGLETRSPSVLAGGVQQLMRDPACSDVAKA